MSTLFGSQKGDKPPTLTLRQFLAAGNAYPKLCLVEVIFKPNKFGGFTLVCSPGFRVQVRSSSPMEEALVDYLNNHSGNADALFVEITAPDKCVWDLLSSEVAKVSWAELGWGFKATVEAPQDKPEGKKTRNEGKPTEPRVS